MRIEPLRQGDIVDIVAPASRCTNEELRNGLKRLKEMGLVPRVSGKLFGPTKLFANYDEERLTQLRSAIYAPDSKMIWCVRGGYGAIRLMPQILRWPRPARAKIFLGYSDITTLHAHFNQKWDWPTLHGPLLDRLGRNAMSKGEKRQLLGMIFGEVAEVEFEKLKPLNAPARRAGNIHAPVHGGNLAIIQSSLGTPAAFQSSKHILFLEDTGERPHRVDRMLTQLSQAGAFAKARAIVFGYLQLSEAKDRRQLWGDVIARFAQEQRIPVLSGLPVGHDPKHQYTLPFNTSSLLRTGAKPSLTVSSGIG